MWNSPLTYFFTSLENLDSKAGEVMIIQVFVRQVVPEFTLTEFLGIAQVNKPTSRLANAIIIVFEKLL